MSQTRKDIIAQLKAAEEQVESLRLANERAIAEMQEQVKVAQIATDTANVEAGLARAEADEVRASLESERHAHAEAIAALDGELRAAKANADELRGNIEAKEHDLDLAKRALSDPRYIDAAMKAFGKDLQPAADAEADRLEQSASLPERTEDEMTGDELWERYYTLPITERRAFYVKHEAKLKEGRAK